MNIEEDYGLQERRIRDLEREADQLLQMAGCNFAGVSRRDVVASQQAFERLAIRTPTGGKPRRRH